LGKRVMVDEDLAKFFDRLNQEIRHDFMLSKYPVWARMPGGVSGAVAKLAASLSCSS
jgi:hypothetical protein